jgi:hypothetical protein
MLRENVDGCVLRDGVLFELLLLFAEKEDANLAT